MSIRPFRLVDLPLPAKVTLTAFLALIGSGYLVSALNIFEHHHEADLEPGLTLDDLRRVYHGLDTETTAQQHKRYPSMMEKMTAPGGPMRKHLEPGGEPAVRALTSWLKNGAPQAGFTRPGVQQPGDPSAQQVIARRCVRCHNATDGEMADVPYATASGAEPEFSLVIAVAAARFGGPTTTTNTMHLAPTGRANLVQITHAHMLSIPVFVVIVTGLFLLTGVPARFKAVVAPLPMLALCADFASWWLARPMEPFVYLIAAAGGLFGAALGVQIVCVFCSAWFGRPKA